MAVGNGKGNGARPKLRSRKDGAAIPLDDADKRLMNLLQSRFPLAEEPFAPIAAEAELELDEVMERTQRLVASGSSARSPRSSTPARWATSRCWSRPRSTPSTPTARRRSSTPTPASRTTTCAPTSSTSGSRSRRRPTPSSGLQGTLEVLQELTGAESIRQLPTLRLFKINMNLEMEKGTDALAAAVEAAPPRELEAPALRRHRHRRDPRAPGPDGGRRPPLRRGRRRGRDEHADELLAHLERDGRAQDPAPRRRDPLPPPRRLLGERHGRLAGARRARSSRSARGWPPCAGSRTATSARPTRTGPTRSSRWPTAARRRSATRSSTRSPTSTTSTATTAPSSTPRPSSRRSASTTSPDDYAAWEASSSDAADAPLIAAPSGPAGRSR